MAINSKAKGKRAELEIAALLQGYGYEARRGVQYHGGEDSPDVLGLPGVHIEVKHVERLNIIEAMAQADRDCGGNMPAVFHRRNRAPWLVTVHFDDFMRLYERNAQHEGTEK